MLQLAAKVLSGVTDFASFCLAYWDCSLIIFCSWIISTAFSCSNFLLNAFALAVFLLFLDRNESFIPKIYLYK